MLVEMIYDVKKGTETGLRKFLFPVLRETYDDLLDAATKPVRADLLLLGELNYAGPIVAEVTGIPWASYVLAPFSFFSAFDPPVLPPYPRLARADKAARDGARDAAAGALCHAQMAGADLRIAARAGIAEGPESDLRCQALARPGAGAFFACAGRGAEGLAGTYADHRLLLLRFRCGQCGACRRNWRSFWQPGEPPVVFTLGSAAVLAAGKFYEHSAQAAMKLGVRAVLLIGDDPRNRPR